MANLTDVKNLPFKIINPSKALGATHIAVEFPEAGHRVNSDNGACNGGKMRGRIQIVKDADGANQPRMYIAQGRLPTDKWNITDTGLASVTPAYTTAFPAPPVGVGSDLKPNYNNTDYFAEPLASVPFPIVMQADLSDLGHEVNYKEYSGKKLGTVVLVDFASFIGYAIAMGSEPDSPWTVHDGTIATPTGTLIPPTSTEHADYKPTVLVRESINSIDFPVIEKGALGSFEYLELYSEYETSRARLDASAVVMLDWSTGKLSLMYCLIESATDIRWVDLGGSLSDVIVGTAQGSSSITTPTGDTVTPAVGKMVGYYPAGTVIDISGTVDTQPLQGLGMTTDRAVGITEMALLLADALKGWTDITTTFAGDKVNFFAYKNGSTLTLNSFSVTYP